MTEILCFAQRLRLRRRRTASGAKSASVFRWNGEAGEPTTVGQLERSCLSPSIHMVSIYCYEPDLILYNANCQMSQIDVANRELNAGELAARVQYLEDLL
jgi:hypothetical protein